MNTLKLKNIIVDDLEILDIVEALVYEKEMFMLTPATEDYTTVLKNNRIKRIELLIDKMNNSLGDATSCMPL